MENLEELTFKCPNEKNDRDFLVFQSTFDLLLLLRKHIEF